MERDFFRIFMPYVIETVTDFEGLWVVMNRAYAPLGFHDSAGLEWAKFPKGYLRFKKFTQIKVKKLEKAGAIIHRNNETGEPQKICLYNDATVPVDRYDQKFDKSLWDGYCNLLSILSKEIIVDCKKPTAIQRRYRNASGRT